MRAAVEQFGDALVKYGDFLSQESEKAKKNQALTRPVRSLEDSQEVHIHLLTGVVEPRYAQTYRQLVAALTAATPYQPAAQCFSMTLRTQRM